MARISEFEQSGADTFEVAITAAEFADLASAFQLRITTFDTNRNEATLESFAKRLTPSGVVHRLTTV